MMELKFKIYLIIIILFLIPSITFQVLNSINFQVKLYLNFSMKSSNILRLILILKIELDLIHQSHYFSHI